MSKAKISLKTRKLVSQQANGKCEYCHSQVKYADSPFDVDHIIPISMGGGSEPDNLAFCCHGCNLFKADRVSAFDLLSRREATIFNPRAQIWSEHFSWSSDATTIVGLTATARVTIDALRLNRRGLVNQRQVLAELGLHPSI
ncbi:MAG: HNH endonuclease [Acidobacteria bacterium]|nr:HNH endonuclease [Acidobacteriota bacterium]